MIISGTAFPWTIKTPETSSLEENIKRNFNNIDHGARQIMPLFKSQAILAGGPLTVRRLMMIFSFLHRRWQESGRLKIHTAFLGPAGATKAPDETTTPPDHFP